MHDLQSLYPLLQGAETVTISARKASLSLPRQVQESQVPLGLVVGSDWVQLTRASLPPSEVERVQKEILSLESLSNGWFNGQGASYERSSLANLTAQVPTAFLATPGLPRPCVVPFPDNTVIFEWQLSSTCIEVVADLTTGLFELFASDFVLDSFEDHYFERLEDAFRKVRQFQTQAFLPRAKLMSVLGELHHQDLAVVSSKGSRVTYLRVGDEWKVK